MTRNRTHTRTRGRLVASLFALAALGVAACGGDDTSDSATTEGVSPETTTEGASPETTSDGAAPESTAGAPEQKSGGTFRYMVPSDVRSWDPILISFNSSGPDRYHAVFGALVVPDPTTGSVRPEIATSVETTDGGTTWVIELRDGVEFSDGTVLDAEAVKFNWDRQADPALEGVHQKAMAGLESYVVTDTNTVTVTLAEPNTQWPHTLANELSYIGSPTALEALGEGFAAAPVGAGPFLVETYTADVELVLVRNDSYYGEPAFFDSVVVVLQRDEAQQQNAFIAGEVDGLLTGSESIKSNLESSADAQSTSTPTFTGLGIGMNPNRAPFDDHGVREAVALAMDVEQIVQGAGEGTSALTTFYPEGHPYYDASLSYPETDLAAAQELIDTYVAANGGEAISITYSYPTTPANDRVAQLLQGQLQQLDNLNVALDPITPDAFNGANLANEYSFFQASFAGALPEPRMYEAFHSDGGANFFQYSNPVVDAALDATRSETDPEVVAQSYKDAAAQIIADLVFIPYEVKGVFSVVSDSVVLRADSVTYAGTLAVETLSFR